MYTIVMYTIITMFFRLVDGESDGSSTSRGKRNNRGARNLVDQAGGRNTRGRSRVPEPPNNSSPHLTGRKGKRVSGIRYKVTLFGRMKKTKKPTSSSYIYCTHSRSVESLQFSILYWPSVSFFVCWWMVNYLKSDVCNPNRTLQLV